MGIDGLALLALCGFVAGFIDALAGGGGLLTVPALALAGLDPVSVIATNKLASCFGSGSSTLAFARAGKIDLKLMGLAALGAGFGSVLGALSLPFAPRQAFSDALPFILVAVALYFAFSARLTDSNRAAHMPPTILAVTIAPLIGFYDGVFGPGAGSFYVAGFAGLAGFGLTRAVAGARLANFASNLGALLVYAFSGQIVVAAGLAMGLGGFAGAQLGARTALRGGARLLRPLIVIASCLLALRLATLPGAPLRRFVFSLLSN